MNTLISQHVANDDALGTASAMLTLGRTLGQTIATGIFGLAFNVAINMRAALTLSTINRYISGIRLPHEMQLNAMILSGFHSVFMLVAIIFMLIIGINALSANGKRIK